jgi:hypothetical protein
MSHLLLLLPNFVIKHDCYTLRAIFKNYLLEQHEGNEINFGILHGEVAALTSVFTSVITANVRSHGAESRYLIARPSNNRNRSS